MKSLKCSIPTLLLTYDYLKNMGGNNRMKRFVAVSLAVLMLLTVFAPAASAQDVIEVRSTVFNGTDIDDIIDTYGNSNNLG